MQVPSSKIRFETMLLTSWNHCSSRHSTPKKVSLLAPWWQLPCHHAESLERRFHRYPGRGIAQVFQCQMDESYNSVGFLGGWAFWFQVLPFLVPCLNWGKNLRLRSHAGNPPPRISVIMENEGLRLGYLRCGPLPVTVTTRIITFSVGDPYKPSFSTVTGRGPHPKDTLKKCTVIGCDCYWAGRKAAWIMYIYHEPSKPWKIKVLAT